MCRKDERQKSRLQAKQEGDQEEAGATSGLQRAAATIPNRLLWFLFFLFFFFFLFSLFLSIPSFLSGHSFGFFSFLFRVRLLFRPSVSLRVRKSTLCTCPRGAVTSVPLVSLTK